jgi:hypothetical protein
MALIRRLLVALALLVCVDAPWVSANDSGSKGGSDTKSAHSATHSRKARSKSTAPRDKNGRIKRSEAAKHQFELQTGYPHGRPGYVVDHIVPLACGGADAPSNMQWQTIAEARAKDKVERVGCR